MDTVQEFASVMNANTPDGQRRHSQEEIEQVMLYLFTVVMPEAFDPAAPALQRPLQVLIAEQGMSAETPPEVIRERIVQHFQDHPPKASLLAGLTETARSLNAERVGGLRPSSRALLGLGAVWATDPAPHGPRQTLLSVRSAGAASDSRTALEIGPDKPVNRKGTPKR